MTTTTTEQTGAPVVALGTPLVAGSHTRAHGNGTAGLETTEAERAERLAAVREGRLGSVHSWELVTAVDGPGTRLTVFLSGCPLRCLYCHNPDTMEMRRGTDVAADEVLAKVARYRGVFRATRGGLTISGGEPLMQPAFVRRLVRGAAAMGVPVAIDTSGFLGAHATDAMLDDVDLVLLDVKSGLPETYRRATGRELQPTLDFGRRLGVRGTRMWIRFVLVPGLTDAPENVAAVADHVVSFGPAVERVEVLPFHQMGRDKWVELGMRYELGDVEPPTRAATEAVRDVFRARGLTTF
ncbi:pyruvate formate lyase-activating protein [Cellulomonas sp. JZ18]|uniref:pyruvate formate-lyase-activating protein n=1 Tax=Cellulomonas sp. JZ18 TaxID=2654191 RepID=UPI0012D41AE8|nr:pyruvate formate-lyase-activating protein [Cellulomonas sp. JZ18]QGQ19498.1 pyruvate formate lyase-activating protein [Cellulomonas sp. JZ18]